MHFHHTEKRAHSIFNRHMKVVYQYFLWLFCFLCGTVLARSPYRPYDHTMPTITVHLDGRTNQTHTFQNSHLNYAIFHAFDEKFFYNHVLPSTNISYRYKPDQHVAGTLLSDLVEGLVQEILYQPITKNKEFAHFSVIKMSNINRKLHTGLFIFRFKDYPFVVKIFIEFPESFVDPCSKGLESICFFYMGGAGRHDLGLLRIKNLYTVRKIVHNDPYWGARVDFPRKWFWLPKQPQWLHIQGKNIGPQKTVRTKIPAIYAIVCDEIIWEREFSLTNAQDRELALGLANFLEQRIDPHINNFGIEKGTGKIVPIDFEHFQTAVGLRADQRYSKDYVDWYMNLTFKSFKDLLFRNKQERVMAQLHPPVTFSRKEKERTVY